MTALGDGKRGNLLLEAFVKRDDVVLFEGAEHLYLTHRRLFDDLIIV